MILVTADWHLSDNPRDNYRHLWQQQLRDMIEEYCVEVLLVLGDLTEEKDRHRAGLVNKVVDHLYQLGQLCQVIVISGNHDYVNPATPFYGFAHRIKGITWVGIKDRSSPKKEALDKLGMIGDALFLPHTTDYKRDWKGLKLNTYDWIFTHNTFHNADIGNGQRVESGIPVTVFGDRPQVISGDVHIPQKLGPVTYVGAPYLIDFGDSYEPRVLLIDKKGQMRSIKTSGPQKRLVTVEFIGGAMTVTEVS